MPDAREPFDVEQARDHAKWAANVDSVPIILAACDEIEMLATDNKYMKECAGHWRARVEAAEFVLRKLRALKVMWLDNGDVLWAREALVEARKAAFDAVAAYDAACKGICQWPGCELEATAEHCDEHRLAISRKMLAASKEPT